MYAVIKQSKLNGIEIKCVTIKLVDAKKLALHYMKQDLDFELAKGNDVKIANIYDGDSELKTVFAEYCLTYTQEHKDETNANSYAVVASPPIISSTEIDPQIDPEYFV
jgi:hypothetical protein